MATSTWTTRHDGRGCIRRSLASVVQQPRRKLIYDRVRSRLYQNLRPDEFRLLDVRKSSVRGKASDFHCDLRREKLSDFPSEPGYVAVSYTWTEHAAEWPPEGSFLPGQVLIDELHVAAGQRLAPMLRSLYNFSCSSLWVDAICIDQGDFAERAQQVSRMRDIYSNANKVVIYLGALTASTRAFFDFINNAAGGAGVKLSPVVFDGLIEVLRNPYWRRAWIVQEVTVARHVQIVSGECTCSWEALIRLLHRWDVSSRLDKLAVDFEHLDRKILAIDDFRHRGRRSLLLVLLRTRLSKASDPLDTIYAKLGLALDAESLMPQLSYKIQPAMLFKRLVKAYWEQRNDLYIICLVREVQSSVIRLPSWTPDWTHSTERRALLRFFYSGWTTITHRPHPRACIRFSHNLNELHVRGRRIDAIGAFAQVNGKAGWLQQDAALVFPAICRTVVPDHFVLPSQDNAREYVTEFIDQFALLAMLSGAEKDVVVSERLFENTVRMTTDTKRNYIMDLFDSPDDFVIDGQSSSPDIDIFREWYGRNRDVRIGAQSVGQWAAEYLQSKHHGTLPLTADMRYTGGVESSLPVMAWKRKLVGTVFGRPALAPTGAADGDLICVLYGCPVPVVLRKASHAYIFIGECYVDDLMDDRVNGSLPDVQQAETTFCLR